MGEMEQEDRKVGRFEDGIRCASIRDALLPGFAPAQATVPS